MKFLFQDLLKTTIKLFPAFLVVSWVLSGILLVPLDRVASFSMLNPERFARFWVSMLVGMMAFYLLVCVIGTVVISRRLRSVCQRTGLTHSIVSWVYLRLELYKEKPLNAWTASWILNRYEESKLANEKLKQNRERFQKRYLGSDEFMKNGSASD